MATQTISHRPRNLNSRQYNREDALRIANEMIAARQAAEAHVIRATVYQTTDPGPDFMPRAWNRGR